MTTRPRSPWRHAAFRLLFAGETVSAVGTAVTSICLPLVAIDVLRASTLFITLLTAGVWLPWTVFGLFAGVVVDRTPRRVVMVTADVAALASLLSVPAAVALHRLTEGQLLAVALLVGTAAVFFGPAYRAYLPSLVDADELTPANAALIASRSAAQIAGPGLGGLIAGTLSPVLGLSADALSFLVSALSLLAIRADEGVPRHPDSRPSVSDDIGEGVRWVARDPLLRAQVGSSVAANFGLTAIDALLVVYLVRTVGVSAGTAGVLLALGSAGGLVGAVVASSSARRLGTARAVILLGQPALLLGLLLPLAQPGAALALFVSANFMLGFGVEVGNVILGSWRQAYVPRHMLGRVSAFSGAAGHLAMPLGAVLAGILASSIGVRSTLWILCAEIAVSGLPLLLSPMRRMRELPPSPPVLDRGPQALTPTASPYRPQA